MREAGMDGLALAEQLGMDNLPTGYRFAVP
jgi:hypothetical protein